MMQPEHVHPEQHVHEYIPMGFWKLDYGWIAVAWECHGVGSPCSVPEYLDSYLEVEKN